MMDIKELKVTVGEVCEGYFNDAEEGVGCRMKDTMAIFSTKA